MFKKALSILLSVMLVVTSLSVAAVSVAAVDDGTKFIVAGSSLDIFGMTWNDSNEDNLMEAKEDGKACRRQSCCLARRQNRQQRYF